MLTSLFQRFSRRPAAAPAQEPPLENRIETLPEAKSAPLPAPYDLRQASALSIEGMMSDFSMAVMDSVLAHQVASCINGHILEIGVWKGRSASIMSAHVRDGERFILCDVNQLLTAEVLGKFYTRPEFVRCMSVEFPVYFDIDQIRGSVRFAHLDSGHGYRDTLAEMALIDSILAPDGIACLDDFTNLNYSQILPAIFKYLYTTNTDLTFFLVTNDKGYLCRRTSFESYAGYVLKQILEDMRTRGKADLMISRTDMDPEYRPFYLRPREQGETGDHYGTALYASCYDAP